MEVKTEIYWNKHKDLFSARRQGRVIGHFKEVILSKPEFVVREAGRQRVLKERRKNVHAFVRGLAVLPETPQGPPRKSGFGPYDQVMNAAKKEFGHERWLHDYTFAVYDPYDECGCFRLKCVIGEIFVRDPEIRACIKMVHAYIWEGRPQIKVKLGEPDSE